MSRDSDRTEALRAELIRAIVEGTGMREVMALPIADTLLCHLQREYGGERLYIPTPGRQYDLLQIKAALDSGVPKAKVCRDFGLSERTLRRLFAGDAMGAKTVADVA